MLHPSSYDLFADGMLTRLADSEDRFIDCMLGNYNHVARRYGCSVNVSAARLADARELWLTDLSDLLSDGVFESETLDQYKQTAFLTFWLRRCKPINAVFRDQTNSRIGSDDLEAFRDWFELYGNESAALNVGAKLCHAYCLRQLIEDAQSSKGRVTEALLFRKEQLTRHLEVAPDFEYDLVVMLKHKNTSPHAITLIFEALFGGLATRVVT